MTLYLTFKICFHQITVYKSVGKIIKLPLNLRKFSLVQNFTFTTYVNYCVLDLLYVHSETNLNSLIFSLAPCLVYLNLRLISSDLFYIYV